MLALWAVSFRLLACGQLDGLDGWGPLAASCHRSRRRPPTQAGAPSASRRGEGSSAVQPSRFSTRWTVARFCETALFLCIKYASAPRVGLGRVGRLLAPVMQTGALSATPTGSSNCFQVNVPPGVEPARDRFGAVRPCRIKANVDGQIVLVQVPLNLGRDRKVHFTAPQLSMWPCCPRRYVQGYVAHTGQQTTEENPRALERRHDDASSLQRSPVALRTAKSSRKSSFALL